MSDRQGKEPRQRFIVQLLAAIGAFTVALLCYVTGLTAPFDRAFVDYVSRLSSKTISSDLVVVEIDARSLHELGSWPWPRSRHAALIDRLRLQGARQIFVDIDFSAPSKPEEDQLLAEALGRARGIVVLPQFWQPLSVDSRPLLLSEPLPALQPYAVMGSVNLVPDFDGLVREVPDLNASDASTAPPVWRRLVGVGPQPALVLDYRLAPASYQKISYSDLLQGNVTPDLQGKTIMVGATAIELGDIVTVPVYRSLPGVLVQATAYESGRRPALRSASPITVIPILAVAALVCVFLMSRRSWRALPWITTALLLATVALSATVYAQFNFLPIPSPFTAVILCSFAGVVLGMVSTETWRSWRAARKLRQQDGLLRQIVDRSADALFTLEPNGLVRTANEATSRLLGRDAVSMPGSSLRVLAPQLSTMLDPLTPEREILREFVELRLESGMVTPIEVSARHLPWDDSSVIVVALHDVSEQQRREKELRHRAMHDGLTGLPNRLKLVELLAAEIPTASIELPLRLLMLDLDGFKEVNDTLGHDMGDALLVELGTRFAEFSKRCLCVARLGGDEFAIVATASSPSDLDAFCAEVKATVSAAIVIKGIPISLGASIGVADAPAHATAPAQLVRCADLALYVAKTNHTDVEIFDPSMDIRSPRRLQMLTLLRSAIQRDELHLLFQPKVSLQGHGQPEVEVLCRWNSATLGAVSPAEFIPLAEASDVIRPLTEWTLASALAACRSWHAKGLPLKIAVNLSARHLQDEQLPTWLGRLLGQSGIGPEFLELEITEGAIMRDPDRALRILQSIRALGITLSIDDYGTGYSSLSYLQKLSVDRLKIDKSFVSGLLTHERDQLIVKSTIELAHALNLQVIAEGIETRGQFEMLRSLKCDYAQGYLMSRPIPYERVFDWFSNNSADQQLRVVNA